MHVHLKDPATGKENRQPCFSYTMPKDYFTVDHDTYIFVAAKSGDAIPNEHVVHGIRFHDSDHVHDDEEEDKAADLKAFSGKYNDIVRKRAISSQETFTVDSYNKELIRHNQIYSQLVSDFSSNSETMISHLNNLPHEEIIKNMSR